MCQMMKVKKRQLLDFRRKAGSLISSIFIGTSEIHDLVSQIQVKLNTFTLISMLGSKFKSKNQTS